MKHKEINYTIEKLDRSPIQKLSFEQRVAKVYHRVKDDAWSMMMHPRKLQDHYEQIHMAHVQLVMKRKREKVMYKQWGGSEDSINTQQFINDLKFGRL